MSMTLAEADVIARLDGHGQAELVRRGEVPPEALVEAAIARIEAVDGALNSVAVRAFGYAREAAARVDRNAAMAAVPYLLKASLEYPGFPCEAGSRAKRGEVAGRAFPLAQVLDRAGMVPVGMSTMPEFGLNASGEALLYGPTCNPWDLSRSSGGSSSGAGAAVAAGLAPFATASDAGGSNVRARRNSGKIRAQSAVTKMAAMPPPTVATIGPISEARKPERASPSSFELEMNRVETDPTRPRIASGVCS